MVEEKKKRRRCAGKGPNFERHFCRLLTAWWSGDPEQDVLFWRTSLSGGRATNRRKVGKATVKAHCGDTYALTAEGEPLTRLITFEAKSGYNDATGVTLAELIDASAKCDAEKSTLLGWICQVVAAARSANTPFWALVHKRDYREPVIYLPNALFTRLSDPCDFSSVNLLSAQVSLDETRSIKLVALSLGDFFRAVRPDTIRRIADAIGGGACRN